MLLNELQHCHTFQSVKQFYPNPENGVAIFRIGTTIANQVRM
ncbi:MAG: hypothetical protein NTU99_08845 [Pseudanabaena sp. LacPavin_0818_WC45_MAG_42_6]|nr:hypothetical protein [Pseudanabaena sp. LacPavin_0818_WC45_MAG_42_6]